MTTVDARVPYFSLFTNASADCRNRIRSARSVSRVCGALTIARIPSTARATFVDATRGGSLPTAYTPSHHSAGVLSAFEISVAMPPTSPVIRLKPAYDAGEDTG